MGNQGRGDSSAGVSAQQYSYYRCFMPVSITQWTVTEWKLRIVVALNVGCSSAICVSWGLSLGKGVTVRNT